MPQHWCTKPASGFLMCKELSGCHACSHQPPISNTCYWIQMHSLHILMMDELWMHSLDPEWSGSPSSHITEDCTIHSTLTVTSIMFFILCVLMHVIAPGQHSLPLPLAFGWEVLTLVTWTHPDVITSCLLRWRGNSGYSLNLQMTSIRLSKYHLITWLQWHPWLIICLTYGRSVSWHTVFVVLLFFLACTAERKPLKCPL
jgi:hypothetical protein